MAIGLEPLGESHLAAVEAMLRDPDVLRFTRVPEPVPPDFPRTWLGVSLCFKQGLREDTEIWSRLRTDS